jgi:DnaJ-class molecular chaperone
LKKLYVRYDVIQGHLSSREKEGGAMKKTIKSKMFDPKKYGMIFCPVCNGSGKSFDEVKGVNVCQLCGGFGLMKKEKREIASLMIGEYSAYKGTS